MIDLQEFLRRGGTDLRSVVARVASVLGLGPDDALLAVGSLVEGLGSCKSDVDLYLITHREDRLLPADDHVAVVIGKCLVDVLILRSARVEQLLTRLETWARSPWNVTHATTFTLAERTMLHRLANGRLLFPAADVGEVMRRPSSRDLARLKLHAARQNARTIQVDMMGYRDEGDHRSLVFAAHDVLGDAIDGLLAGHLVTNPLPKWRSRLLDSLPADWEQCLTVRATGLPANEVVWRLHRAPERPVDEECLAHALRITTFARNVFSWAERRLETGTALTRDPSRWSRIQSWAGQAPLPFLDLDIDYMLHDGAVAIGRLNDFGQPLTLTPREFDLCLLFDGTTTAQEAERAVYGDDDATDGGIAERLANRLAQANLSVLNVRHAPLAARGGT